MNIQSTSGADEIDIVISRRHVLEGNWKALYKEIKDFRKKCGTAHMKTILATGELGNLSNIAKASQVCMMAGADFIKTSTGKEPVNATLPVSLVMARMIRNFYEETGCRIGFKAAGGISDSKTALVYMTMIKEELGRHVGWSQTYLDLVHLAYWVILSVSWITFLVAIIQLLTDTL